MPLGILLPLSEGWEFGWLLRQMESSPFGCWMREMAGPGFLLVFKIKWPPLLIHLCFLQRHHRSAEMIMGMGDTKVHRNTGVDRDQQSQYPALLGGREMACNTGLSSCHGYHGVLSSSAGPMVRGTPHSSQGWGPSFRSESPPTSLAPETGEHYRRRCLRRTRALSRAQLCRHTRLLPSGTGCCVKTGV